MIDLSACAPNAPTATAKKQNAAPMRANIVPDITMLFTLSNVVGLPPQKIDPLNTRNDAKGENPGGRRRDVMPVRLGPPKKLGTRHHASLQSIVFSRIWR